MAKMKYLENDVVFGKNNTITLYVKELTYNNLERIAKQHYKDKRCIDGLIRCYAMIKLHQIIAMTYDTIPIHSELFANGVSKRHYTDFLAILEQENLIQIEQSKIENYKDKCGKFCIKQETNKYRVLEFGVDILGKQSGIYPVKLSLKKELFESLKIKYDYIRKHYFKDGLNEKRISTMLYKNNEFVNDFYPNDKKYKFMKHPLIKIDDLIGNTFNDQRFSKKDRKRISKVLSYVALKGMLELKLSHKLLLAKMMIKYHVKYSELVDMYNTYIASWGGKAITYTFKAIKDEKVIKEVTLGPSLNFDLKVNVNKKELVNEDTYDVCKISLKYVDQYDNLMNYANKAISIDVEGPVTLLSPKIESLLGGQLSIYVKSKNEKGKAKITITCEDIVKEVILEVK